MMILPLAKISVWWTLFAFLWAVLAAGLILIVLIQKGRGGGIGAAFGGGGGANSLLGTKTGDFLTWVTICLVSLFLVGAVVMGKYMRPSASSGLIPMTAPMQSIPQSAPAIPADLAGEAVPAAQTEVFVEETLPAAQEAAAETAEPSPEQH